MKMVNFRKLKLSYAILMSLWTMVVMVSFWINGSTGGQNYQAGFITHMVVWVTALMGITYNYRQMTRALNYRKELAIDLEKVADSTEELIDALPFGVVLIGKDKIIRKANQEAGRILGREVASIIGQICHQNICPAQVAQCPILDKHQVVDRSEKNAVGANGEEIPVYKSVIPYNWHGEDVLLEAFVDISERKNHEKEMNKNLADLQKFNRLAIGRELKMIELKAEINGLLQKQGESDRYKRVTLENTDELDSVGELC